MDRTMAADLDRHLTTEPTSETIEYEIGDVPAIRALVTMYVSDDGGPFGLARGIFLDQDDRDDEALRQHLYDYYESTDMAKALFLVGWERGVNKQELRLVEAEEVNEGDEIDDDGEARFYYLHGYIAGQLSAYKDPDGIAWETPWAATADDEFFEGV